MVGVNSQAVVALKLSSVRVGILVGLHPSSFSDCMPSAKAIVGAAGTGIVIVEDWVTSQDSSLYATSYV